jgi:hypothetical protein
MPIARLQTIAERDEEWVEISEKLINEFNRSD